MAAGSNGSKETILEFRPVGGGKKDCVAVLSLNRPKVANAMSAVMMDEITTHLQTVHENDNCRAMVLRGLGDNFCAGADLGWMQDSAKFSYEENITDSTRLLGMFQALYALRVPTIAAVQGAVYGGAVGLVACCDITIAEKNAKFCMSEVRLGLIPAVIFPYLAMRIMPGQLRRHSLSGKVFNADAAYRYGLIDVICQSEELDDFVRKEIDNVLKGCPDAQSMIKDLHQRIVYDSMRQGPHTVEAIATARTADFGQEGLKSFFEKRKPVWALDSNKDWTLDGK